MSMRALFGLVLTMFLTVPMKLLAKESEDMERFNKAWSFNDGTTLEKLAEELLGRPNGDQIPLTILTLAAIEYRLENAKACLDRLYQLDSLSIRTGDHALRPWSHRLRALVCKKVRDLPKALNEIDRALALLQGREHQEQYSACLVIRAEILRKLNDLKGALAALEEARIIAEESDFGPTICNVLINRGNLYYDQDRFEEAWNTYRLTIDRTIHYDLKNIMAKAVMNLGAVAYMLDRYDQAEHLYDSIYSTLSEGHNELKAELLVHSGSAKFELGRVEEAMAYYHRALALHQSVGDTSAIAKTYQLISTVLWHQGHQKEAINVLEKANELARLKKWTALETESLGKLHSWYEQVGDDASALKAMNRYAILSDSLTESRFHNELANAEVRYDTERKERELALRNAQLSEEVAISERRSTQRNMLFGVVALLLLLGFVGYRNIKHRQSIALKDKELSEQRVEEILRSQELRLVSAVMEGQEKERERVSKDLHDRLGSMLSSIKLQFSTLESRIKELKGDQENVYEKVLHMLDNAVGEVRRISRDMASGSLARFGLAAALTDLRESISIKGTLDVELSVFGLERRLDSTVEITAYRVIQELVSNALKHAKASELSIYLTRSENELSIIVADNGVGFDFEERPKGMGLNNVQNRVSMLGGTVHVDSTPGKGTSVSVTLPLGSS